MSTPCCGAKGRLISAHQAVDARVTQRLPVLALNETEPPQVS
ncbi:hypothetical protein [Mitsuaria sp. WAJ17]|nr:hypothetical protein [Mitsuaria sp. WAJ17]